MQQTQTFLVFVYGSLRIDEENHHYLASSELVCEQCFTDGRLFDTGWGYPAMISYSGEKVIGELYRVTTEVLKMLDALEDYNGEGMENDYERVIQPIYTDNGYIDAYVYVYPKHKAEGLHWIKDGDWKHYRKQKNEFEKV